MKRTASLLGLFFIGLTLLINPLTGISATFEEDGALVDDAALIQTTGSPPLIDPTTTTATPAATSPPVPTGAPTTTNAGTTSVAPNTTTTTEPPTTTTVPKTTTVLGPAVPSEWGPFQVQITVENGVLVDIETVQQPPDRKSQRINRQALPVYIERAIKAQGTNFDVISGATVTWDLWGKSLREALEEAAFGQ